MWIVGQFEGVLLKRAFYCKTPAVAAPKNSDCESYRGASLFIAGANTFLSNKYYTLQYDTN